MDDRTVSIGSEPARDGTSAAGTWGPLNLIQRVGQGAFGEVYRAFDTTLHREVALKLLLPRGQDAESETRVLLKEARAMARVRHPNVVSVYGVDRHDGRVGFWTDFVHGKTLSAILAADGPFGAREAALIGIDLCKAVGAVHAAGLLHRDIKSGNVMRESGGRILLMDFGLTHDQSAQQQYSGTPVYMAPELFAGEPASTATDIYALGILLFHLLTGKYPVDGSSLSAIRAAHEFGPRLTMLDLRPDLPEPLARVVEMAANPSPAKRFASTGQMIGALSDAVGLGSVTLELPVKPKSNRLGLWVLAGVATLLAAFLSVPLLRSAFQPASTTPVATVRDDYEKARDLLDHYYRPQALDTAIPLLEKTVERDPNLAPAYADLGRANLLQYIQLRDDKYFEPARQSSLRALSLNPNLASPHVTLGTLYTWTGKRELASQELEEALKLDKFNASAYAAQGNLLVREGRNAEAEPLLQKAASLAPEDWGILVDLGGYYDELGKYDQAIEQYRKAVEVAPDNARAHNNLAFVNRLQGRHPEAEAEYREAVVLDPTSGHYRNLGQVLMEEGKYSEAKLMLERAVSLNAGEYRAWGFLATVDASTSVDYAKVEETYRKAITLGENQLKLDPDSAYLFADLAGYYAALGMDSKSLPLLQRAVAHAPDTPGVLYEVAAGYDALHRRDEALLWIDRAVAAGLSPQFLERIAQLAALRSDPRYQKAVSKQHAR